VAMRGMWDKNKEQNKGEETPVISPHILGISGDGPRATRRARHRVAVRSKYGIWGVPSTEQGMSVEAGSASAFIWAAR
jgi:hypothetical protein